MNRMTSIYYVDSRGCENKPYPAKALSSRSALTPASICPGQQRPWHWIFIFLFFLSLKYSHLHLLHCVCDWSKARRCDASRIILRMPEKKGEKKCFYFSKDFLRVCRNFSCTWNPQVVSTRNIRIPETGPAGGRRRLKNARSLLNYMSIGRC